jgi:CCR4-NOT transcriptional regulation complex NOT5 subunit
MNENIPKFSNNSQVDLINNTSYNSFNAIQEFLMEQSAKILNEKLLQHSLKLPFDTISEQLIKINNEKQAIFQAKLAEQMRQQEAAEQQRLAFKLQQEQIEKENQRQQEEAAKLRRQQIAKNEQLEKEKANLIRAQFVQIISHKNQAQSNEAAQLLKIQNSQQEVQQSIHNRQKRLQQKAIAKQIEKNRKINEKKEMIFITKIICLVAMLGFLSTQYLS